MREQNFDMTYKGIVSCIISIMITLGLVLGLAAEDVSAAVLKGGEKGSSTVTNLGKSKDGKGWNNPHHPKVKQYKYTVKINGESKAGYCMESTKGFGSGNKYTAKSPEKANAWKKLPAARQRVLALVLYYGYNSGKTAPYGNSNDYYAATQVLVWEAADGDIKLSSSGKWSKSSNKHDDLIKGRSYAEKNYNWIKDKISRHVKGASFSSASYSSAGTYVMKYSYKNKNWSCTVADKNKANYFKKHKDTTSGLSMNRSGYSYTFKAASAGTKKAVLINDKSSGTSQAMLVLAASNSSKQALIFGARDDTKFYAKFRTEAKGKCKLIKTSDDKKVSGFKFKVTCSGNGYSAVHTTNADGTISLDLYPGVYTVQEQLTDAQKKDGYIQAKAKTVTIKENQTATVKIHNKKIPEGSNLLLEKENGDGSSAEGFRFEITNKTTGEKTECVTGEDGSFLLKDIELGEYVVTEILSEEQKQRFEEPESKTVAVTESGKTVTVAFVNKPKTTEVILKKTCIDGKVEGIEFVISGETIWGEVMETRTVQTSEDGTISFGELQPGTYRIEEVPVEGRGYLIQEPKFVTVTGNEKEPLTVEFNNVPTSLYVTKVDAENGQFVDGASFELLDPDGMRLIAFTVTREDDRVTLKTDAADSEIFSYDDPECMEYGCLKGLITDETYILREISAPEGYMLVGDISFTFEEGMEITVENEKEVIPEPEKPEIKPEEPKPEKPEKKPESPEPEKKDSVAETGDMVSIWLPVILMTVAMAVAAMLFVRREKEE